MKQISDHGTMKLNNQLTVLKHIREGGPISRVDLQGRTKLSWGTITSSIKELLGKGIIKEIGSVTTGKGRRPVELDMNTERNVVLGLRLGSYAVRSVLVDIKGTTLDELELKVDPAGTKTEIFNTLRNAAKQLLRRNQVGSSCLAGIGVAAPGAVDFRTGVCHYAPHHPNWKSVPLKARFEEEFEVPCFVDHVSNCFALSEKLFGHGKTMDSFVCVLLGTGVSAGIVIHGEVYRGTDCFAGEFGHTCIDPDGPPCVCGNRGCVEAYTSGPALARMAREKLQDHRGGRLLRMSGGDISKISGESIWAAAKAGDRMAEAVLRSMGKYLGIGISNLINLFNPECVILGGRVAKASEFFLPTFLGEVQERAWHGSGKDVRVSRLENGPVLGAAAIVLQEVFNRGLIVR
jgi:predicted NBD/HSP70 family sugar kinase